MGLAGWFWKRYNGDLPTGGKSPFRKRISKFRHAGIESRTKRFQDTRASERVRAGAKKMQDVEGIQSDTPVRLM